MLVLIGREYTIVLHPFATALDITKAYYPLAAVLGFCMNKYSCAILPSFHCATVAIVKFPGKVPVPAVQFVIL